MSDVFHYTTQAHLYRILESKVLQPSGAGLPANERPALWFSSRQDFEPTAIKMVADKSGTPRALTLPEQIKLFGLARFVLSASDPRLLPWGDACRAAGTSRDNRRALERVGVKRGGNPAHWFASLVEIPISELRFQLWMPERKIYAEFDPQIWLDASQEAAQI